MNQTRPIHETLSRQEWYQMRDAILCAVYNREDSARDYQLLSNSLKTNAIGDLINRYLHSKNKNLLDKAACLLAGTKENAWLLLEKS